MDGENRTPDRPEDEGLGVSRWMWEVLAQRDRAAAEFAEDPIHDLRVAIRRCRSMAAGLQDVDADPGWRRMSRAGKRLFDAVGDLRDTQVMIGWVERLRAKKDPAADFLLGRLREREGEQKARAAQAVARFDQRAWKRWADVLGARARRLSPEGPVFRLLALERFLAARALHRLALRDRTRVAFHRLRVGLKRFRYVVENFLPAPHAAWGRDLKHLQDVLGEVHDLDVLWATLRGMGAALSKADRLRWKNRILAQRNFRLSDYRTRMIGPSSLWNVWRAGLPAGDAVREAVFAKVSALASSADPAFDHAAHVAYLADQLLDGLRRAGIPAASATDGAPEILRAAALLHGVGRNEGGRSRPRHVARVVRAMAAPVGWSDEAWEAVALAIRFHRGDPSRAIGTAPERPDAAGADVPFLVGVLRLADALDARHDRCVRRVDVESSPDVVLVRAAGCAEGLLYDRRLADARGLLESVLRRGVVVRPGPPLVLVRAGAPGPAVSVASAAPSASPARAAVPSGGRARRVRRTPRPPSSGR